MRQPAHGPRPRAGRAPLRGPRRRRGRQLRPHAGGVRLDDPRRRRRRRARTRARRSPPETRITAAPGELITDEAGTRYDTTNRAATFRFVGQRQPDRGLQPRRTSAGATTRSSTTRSRRPTCPPRRCSRSSRARRRSSTPSLAYGGHIFEVRAIDLAGNKDTHAGMARVVDPPAAAGHHAARHHDPLRPGPGHGADERALRVRRQRQPDSGRGARLPVPPRRRDARRASRTGRPARRRTTSR